MITVSNPIIKTDPKNSQKEECVNILIGGDIVPTNSNMDFFIKGDIEKLIGIEMQEKLRTADFRIFNLEVPLTNSKSPIVKCGPNLSAPKSVVKGLIELGVDFLSLANNHIFDYGENGLLSTTEVLTQAGIAYSGVGKNLVIAAEPYIKSINGINIGVYCCAEHEFSIATKTSAGVNPFDSLTSYDHISKLKKQCDRIIVLYHGGIEYYRYPSPRLQKICQKFIESGANLVVCQHSHCIGCEEKYKHGTIVYGQGNFVFDRKDDEYWRSSLLILCKLTKKGESISYIPVIKTENTIRLAKKQARDEILNEFYERSSSITTEGYIEAKYCEFTSAKLAEYLVSLSGYKLHCRIIRRIIGGKAFNKLFKKKLMARILNYIECESHQEVICAGIKELLR